MGMAEWTACRGATTRRGDAEAVGGSGRRRVPLAAYTPGKARWKPTTWSKGGGGAARRDNAAAARSSIGGRRVLGDVRVEPVGEA